MASDVFAQFQEWLADRGIGQYPLPRRAIVPARTTLAEKWVHAMMMLLLTLCCLVVIALGLVGLYICYLGLRWSLPIAFGH